jgi:predicted AlkP superfamily phosphohydrolase/phosphomutase
VEMRAELTSHFLAKGGWDLFMQVFTESHCAGHLVWHLHDPTHPAHDPGLAARLGDPLRQVYAAIDKGLGQILETAGDVPVIVFGAHGMSYWYGAQFVLKDILFRLGASEPIAGPAPRGFTGQAARAIRQWVPQSVRDAMRPRRRLPPRIEELPPLPQLDVDPHRSKCFVVPNGHLTGAIRLNLAGREPHGVLHPGAEADEFCRALARDLLEIVDERTGRPVIRRVTRTSDAFQGEFMGSLPDLLVDWDDEAPTGSSHHAGGAAATVRLHSPGIGSLEGTNQYHRTGDHRIGGIFVAAGRGIRPGTLLRTISTLDIAPTLAAMLGESLTGVDGEVIREVVVRG